MAEKPQEPRCPVEAKHSGVQPLDKRMNVMLLRVVKADGPLHVQDSGLLVEAYLAQGNSLFLLGRLIPAMEHTLG